MAGLDPAIHVFVQNDKRGHDEVWNAGTLGQ
jgi:hypothetical protein